MPQDLHMVAPKCFWPASYSWKRKNSPSKHITDSSTFSKFVHSFKFVLIFLLCWYGWNINESLVTLSLYPPTKQNEKSLTRHHDKRSETASLNGQQKKNTPRLFSWTHMEHLIKLLYERPKKALFQRSRAKFQDLYIH